MFLTLPNRWAKQEIGSSLAEPFSKAINHSPGVLLQLFFERSREVFQARIAAPVWRMRKGLMYLEPKIFALAWQRPPACRPCYPIKTP